MNIDRLRIRWLGGLIALSLPFAAASCGDDNGGTSPSTTGNLEVSAITTGSNLDDGYTVSVDSGTPQAIGANGTVTISNLTAGSHSVELAGIQANCTVDADNPRSVTVTGGSTASTTFAVTCTADTGDLEVTATTTGDDIDANGYTVSVDGGSAQPVDPNGTVTIPDVAAGNHDVLLGDLASNCTVAGDNPRTVSVTVGGTATTTFDVACSSLVGAIEATTATTGNNPDDAYQLVIDAGAPQAIGADDVVTITDLAAGDHSVQLDDVADNCTVTGNNPQTVAVTAGATATTQFDVTCTAGTIDVTTSTWGLGLDADGYDVTMDASTAQAIGINETVPFVDLDVGNRQVTLTGLAANCSVQGENPRTVPVVDGQVAGTQFDVFCFENLSGDVAFESDRDGNREVYFMQATGANQTNLTNNAASDGRPDVASGGAGIVFESDRSGAYRLWVMSASGVSRLTSSSAEERDPSWGGGQIVAYARKSGSSQGYEIWRVFDNGSTETQLTGGAWDDEQPAVSPDGSYILYRRDTGGAGDIWVMNANGTNQTQLTVNAADDGKPAWSADGSKIVWATNRDGNYEVYSADFDSGAFTISALTNLTGNAANDVMPAWASDNSRILFASDRGGNTDVWDMGTDGSNPGNVSNRVGAVNFEPAWGQ